MDRYRDNLLKQGVTPTRAYQQSRGYAARLRTSRARAIAQTETTRALWEGQQQFWDQAMIDGLVDPASMRKRWRTAKDERVCPICGRMHNVTIGWHDKWALPDGTFTTGPPAHTNCRCEVTVLWQQFVVSKNESRGYLLAKALA